MHILSKASKKKDIFFFLLPIFFVFISFLVHGYPFGTGDQVIHLPIIEKISDNSSFNSDYIFTSGQEEYSLFYPFVATSIRLTGLRRETFFFIGSLIINISFYFVLFLFGKKYFSHRLFPLFFLGLFYIFPFFVGGSAVQSIDINFVPRWIAFVLSLYCFYWLIDKRLLLFAIFMPLVFSIHPLTFLHFSIIMIFYIFLNKLYKKISLVHVAFFLFTFIGINHVLVTSFFQNLSLNGVSTVSKDQWIAILRDRNRYAFLDLWNWKDWLSISVPIFFLSAFSYRGRKKNQEILLLTIAILGSFMIAIAIQLAGASWLASPYIVQLQLARIGVYVFFATALACSYSFSRLKIEKQLIIMALAVLLLLGKWVYLGKTTFSTQNTQWVDIQEWSQKHTSPDCIFLTPLDLEGFRVYSKRSPVIENKDGTLSFYSPRFAVEWYQRKRNLNEWEKKSPVDLENLQKHYHFSYLISTKEYILPFSRLYENNGYVLYAMPKAEESCHVI